LRIRMQRFATFGCDIIYGHIPARVPGMPIVLIIPGGRSLYRDRRLFLGGAIEFKAGPVPELPTANWPWLEDPGPITSSIVLMQEEMPIKRGHLLWHYSNRARLGQHRGSDCRCDAADCPWQDMGVPVGVQPPKRLRSS
jgi:hypothetical protein